MGHAEAVVIGLLAVPAAYGWECGSEADVAAPRLHERSPPPLPGGDKTACIDPQAAADARNAYGTLDGRLRTEHFEIAYPTADPIASADHLANLSDALETAWDVEVGELGWPAPLGSADHYVEVVVTNFPADAPYGGIASTGDCDGEDVGYLLLNTDLWYQSPDYLRDVPSHELDHLLQYASPADYQRTGDDWFYEATAVWMEDRVFADSDTWAVDFLPEYYADPGAGLSDFVYATGPQYAHFVWVRWLDEHAGGPDVVRDAWTTASPGEALPDTLDGVLGAPDSVEGRWADFLAHMAALDVSDHDLFVAALERSDAPYYEADAEVPASADGIGRPERLGAAYLHLTAPPGDGIAFTFDGDPGDGWVVGGMDAGGIDGDGPQTATTDEDGHAELAFAGSEAWVGVGPTVGDAHGWSWSAEATAPSEDPPSEEPKACGCATEAPSGGGIAGLASLVLLLRARSLGPRRRSERGWPTMRR